MVRLTHNQESLRKAGRKETVMGVFEIMFLLGLLLIPIIGGFDGK